MSNKNAVLVALAYVLLPSVGRPVTIRVPLDQPTIQAGINAAMSGDTVLVSCGTYYEHAIRLKDAVVVRSETGIPDCATVHGEDLDTVFDAAGGLNRSALVQGFTITRGRAPVGGGLRCPSSWPSVDNCLFVDNAAFFDGGAVSVADGGPKFTRCVFVGNHSGEGGGAVSCQGGSAQFEDCQFTDNVAGFGGAVLDWVLTGDSHMHSSILFTSFTRSIFVRNRASYGGAMALASHIAITNCTFHDNEGSYGSAFFVCANYASIDNSIISSGRGRPVSCGYGCPSLINFSCTDIYGNAGGDWVGCIADQLGTRGNFTADPAYCDPPSGDLRLRSESPCAPANSPGGCGLVGALPVACGSTAVQPSTWGSIKARFR